MSDLDPPERLLEILLIEDQAPVAHRVETALEQTLEMGWELRRESRLSDGLDRLERDGADLVLLDLDLPDGSDIGAIRRMRAVEGSRPILALTGAEDEEAALEALRAGAHDCLSRDALEPETLGVAVRRSVDRELEAERMLRRSEQRLRDAQRIAGVGNWTWRIESGALEWSDQLYRLVGYEPGQIDPNFERFLELVHPEDRDRLVRVAEEVLEGRETVDLDHRVVRPDGEVRWVHQQGEVVRTDDGDPARMIGVAHDITDRKRAREELRRSEERLERVLETMAEGLCITDEEGTIRFANQGAEEVLGVPVEELEGRRVTDDELSGGRWRRYAPEGGARRDEELATHRALVSGEPVYGVEHVLRRPGEDPKFVSVSAAPLRDPDGKTEGVVLSLRDVTRQRQFEEELERRALYDGLTGLPNRALFFDRLEQAGARAARQGAPYAVFFLDLDRFKSVNDSLGHAVGDQVLERVAGRIEQAFRDEDTVARIGGDEFVVLLEGIEDRQEVDRAAERLEDALEGPLRLAGEEFHLPASVGIALGEGELEPDRIVQRADNAMYRVKDQGGAGCHVFQPGEDVEETNRLHEEARLREGIERGEFTLHFHPVVDLDDGEVRGVEALARWEHPQRGLLPPTQFINLAEETGLIIPLGEKLLREACRTVTGWPSERPIPVFVNLSARQFEWPDLLPTVSEVLSDTGMAAGRLRFEVTERLVMQTAERVSAVKELGVELIVDDFGTGYSSLAYLRDLPVDGLKVDRSFISGIARDSSDQALVQTIITLGRTLDLDVIAEGVETPEQREKILELGCSRVQGFLFGKPMPASGVEALLRNGVG